jgi:hypothetical protein
MRSRTAVVIASVLVIPLSILQHFLPASSGLFYVLFYALFPGNAVHLMITGGHGGTRIAERVAPWLGGLTNIAAYWVLILIFARSGRPAATRSD